MGFEDSRPIFPCPQPGETRQDFHPYRPTVTSQQTCTYTKHRGGLRHALVAVRVLLTVDHQGYATHAWGTDELQPLTREGTNSFRLGLTIVSVLVVPSAWLLPPTISSDFLVALSWRLSVRKQK